MRTWLHLAVSDEKRHALVESLAKHELLPPFEAFCDGEAGAFGEGEGAQRFAYYHDIASIVGRGMGWYYLGHVYGRVHACAHRQVAPAAAANANGNCRGLLRSPGPCLQRGAANGAAPA